MSIFKDVSDHEYESYLNLMFADAKGKLNPDQLKQTSSDFLTLGVAYLKNAEITLSYILDQGPNCNESSTMIFPVLFTMWHGIELMLKSGNLLCDFYLNESEQNYKKHTIDVYLDLFIEKMKRLGFENIENTHLAGISEFVEECKAKNAHFDFARYANQSNGDKQFYNKPNQNGVISNSVLDMIELGRVLTLINYGSTRLIQFLFDYLNFWNKHGTKGLNEFAFEKYCENSSFVVFVDNGRSLSLEEMVENLSKPKSKEQGNDKKFFE